MTLPRDPDGRPPGDQARAPTPPDPAPAVALRAIGVVESTLTSRSAAPRQGDEGAPDAWLALDPSMLRRWRASSRATTWWS